MQTNNTPNNPQSLGDKAADTRRPAAPIENTMGIQEMLSLCLSKWWWFVISFVAVMSLATLYLLTSTPVYTRTAAILIKEEGKGKASFSDELSSFSSMGLFSSSANVDNEIVAIQSPAVISEVIRRLHLDVSYTADGFFHKDVLYGHTLPVTVTVDGLADNDDFTFDLHLQEAGKVTATDLLLNGEEVSGEFEGRLEQSIVTPVCTLSVASSPMYLPADSCEDDVEEIDLIHVTRSGIISSIQAHSERLTAELNGKKTTIIDLAYNDVSIQRAEDFLNTLIAIYNENWVKDKNQIAVSTSAFIDERLRIIESELGNVDSDISSYKSAHQVPNLETAANMYMTQASEANTRAMDVNNQLYMARYIRQFITDRANTFQLLPANSGIGSTSIERQISEYNEKLLQRNALVANSSENNPMVIDYDESLLAMRQAIVASVDNEINALSTQIKALKASELQSTAKITSNPTQARYLLSVERQQKVKESLYLFLLQKREENELSQAFTAYNTRIVTPPSGSLKPVSPEKKKILLAAFLLSLAIPASILYARETMDTKVRGRKDIEQLDIPFLGEIPQYKEKGVTVKHDKNGRELDATTVVVKERSRNVINEAFRVLRARMDFMLTSGSSKVIMFTSANPGSGKTFLTANMAASFAIRNMRVAVLDLDLRRASLSRYVNRPKKGLSEFLGNQVDDWRKVMVRDVLHPGVDVMPVGTIPPNPSELLYSNNLTSLMNDLREQYDVVIIDCPPVEIVADASIINRLADMTVFVIRSGLFEKGMLPMVQKLYAEKELNSMALLLNGTELARGRYGYHRYGYHYGYGDYAYGEEHHHHKHKQDKEEA